MHQSLSRLPTVLDFWRTAFERCAAATLGQLNAV